ncbi:uncharacterized protein LOC129565689 [Sitodiplosis mosellana]|uniref:uncharacterized protein LOC129565689 n=1 Tax=Sitodiplosis mosellana TaxID=263140 RepID=UPI0024440B04|nr:uncharacterized protein LOC129565689 [Sitodiplosis mosellana]
MKAHQLALLFGCLAAVVLCSTANAIKSVNANDKVEDSVVKEDNTAQQQGKIQSGFQLKVKASDISKPDECLESTEIKLHEVGWIVKMCKKTKKENDKPVLEVFLKSVFSDEQSKWSCEAEANFVLKNITDKESTIKKDLKKQFSKDDPKFEFPEFTDWDNFEKYLSTEQVATFDITLIISPPNWTKLEPISTVFDFIVPNVNLYTSPNGTRSNEVVLRGIRWYFKGMKAKKADKDYFAIFLYANQSDMELNYQHQFDAKAIITVLSNNKDVKPPSRTIEHKFHWRSSAWGHIDFIEWNKFTDKANQFVENSGAIFKIDMCVDAPKPLS